MKFYPQDWRADEKLRMCSLAARGLWMEMLCLAAKSDRPGFLLLNGRPLDPADLARLVGASEPETARLVGELEQWGVFSRDRHGCIFDRALVRAHVKRALRQIARDMTDDELLATAISWSAARKAVFERDGLRCTYCGSEEGPFEVDHIVPRSRGGSNCPSNLTVACRPCNISKFNHPVEVWLDGR